MAGWFETFANFAKGAAPAFDRYQALRQLDMENQLKLRQQKIQESNAEQQQAMNDRQMQLLDLGILGKKKEDFVDFHTPGQVVDQSTYNQAGDLGLGDLFRNIPQVTGMDMAASVGHGLPSLTADTGVKFDGLKPTEFQGTDQPIQYNTAPSDQYAFMGTPQQRSQLADQETKRFLTGIDAMSKMSDMQDKQFKNKIMQQLLQGGQGPNTTPGAIPTIGGDQIDIGKLFGLPTKNPDPVQPINVVRNGKPMVVDARTQQPLLDPTTHQPYVPYKTEGNNAGFSPDAIAGMLEFTKQTGNEPPLGFGGAKGRDQYFAALGKMIKDSQTSGQPINLAAIKGQVGANTSSLRNMETISDLMNGFHQAVGANQKVLEDRFNKLKDYGSEAFNTPIRELGKKFKDPNGDIAGTIAAANTYLREYVRLTNNPKLTGVLSDDARHEAQDMLQNGFTMAQFYNILDVMNKDMDNVETGVHSSINDIKDRMLNPGGKKNNNQPSTGSTGSKVPTTPPPNPVANKTTWESPTGTMIWNGTMYVPYTGVKK